MIAMIIAFLVVVLSFNFFMISYQVSGINRLVLGMPISLYETAIEMFDIDEDNGPYFDKEILENNITYYFSYHMPRYTEEYDLEFYYYRPDNYSLDMSNEVRAVEITLRANLMAYYFYQKTMYYEIRGQ